MTVGIEKIGFYTPQTYMPLKDLAQARGVDPNKYLIGLGQEEMAIPPLYEDAVTMAANAALALLDDEDRKAIRMVLVGSESGVDNSKSIATYLQGLLGLSNRVRAVELKQACYGATMGLQMAKDYLQSRPDQKVLVLASDIAKYGLNTPGEPTQGAGAVAMLLSHQPKVAILEEETAFWTEDIMDFWRPVYSKLAFADGKFSTDKYIAFFKQVWQDYKAETGRDFNDFAALCFHLPFTKIGQKALLPIFEAEETPQAVQERLLGQYEISKTYNKKVGNIYTGSLYLSLLSLLENSDSLQAGDRIGLFSYGSGAVGEFFSLTLSPGYKTALQKQAHQDMLAKRQALSLAAYEAQLQASLPEDGSSLALSDLPEERIVLTKIDQHIRYYGTSKA